MRRGERIAKYEVLERLGTGGMAEVYKCHLTGIGGFDKAVVVKRMLPHLLEDEGFVAMFLDEARIAANLSHPNIVQTFEIGQDEQGLPYIAMEYVRGPTLAALVRATQRAGQPLPVGLMVRIVRGAALGLDSAHRARAPDGSPLRIVHRDVSPQNVLVTLEGVAKVLDFGVARAEGRLTHTRGGLVKGKLRYLAPEALSGDPSQLDARADVFSLGVCLYGAVVGRLPFDGATDAEVMEAISSGRYAPAREVRPDLPPAIAEAIDWSLRRDVAGRCPDGAALADVLAGWLRANPDGNAERDVGEWVVKVFPSLRTDAWHGATATPRTAALPPPPPPDATPFDPAGAEEVDLELSLRGVEVTGWRRHSKFGATALGLAAVLTAVPIALLRSPPPPPAPVVAAPPIAAAVESIAPYLDEAERLLARKQFAQAHSLLDRARQRPALTVEDDVRLIGLQATLGALSRVDEARRALEGGDEERAEVLAREALVLDPGRGDAQEVLAGVAQRRSAALQAVDAGGPPDLVVRREPRMREVVAARVVPADPAAGVAPAEREAPAAEPGPPPPGLAALEADPQPVIAPRAEEYGILPSAHPGASSVSPRLHITSTVRAQVHLDGVPVGATPVDTVVIAPGVHIVTLEADGYLVATEVVTLAPGRKETLAVTLHPVPAGHGR